MTTPLSPPAPNATTRRDRIAGVLVGSAVGDALGVPYEFGARFSGSPQMVGGGLGDYAPGEYSDDTQMAVCIALVSSTGGDLRSEATLDAVASNFIGWLTGGATDVGVQTRSVLTGAKSGPGAAGRLRDRAARLHERTGRSAGNGALMRTGVVGVTQLGDRVATAATAEAVAVLTHWDPLAVESCILWSEAVRRAVQDGTWDLVGGLDLLPPARQAAWREWIDAATGAEPGSFANNGFTVAALQAAWAAITSTANETDPTAHVMAGIEAAVHAGNDTDTVAAIAGSLLGARYGRSAIPADWRVRINGWPGGLTERDLANLALRSAGKDELTGDEA